MSRIYKVMFKGHKEAKLVKSNTKAGAIRQASIGTISAEVASQDDLVSLIAAGVKVEESIESVPTEGDEAKPTAKARRLSEDKPMAKDEVSPGLKGAFATV